MSRDVDVKIFQSDRLRTLDLQGGVDVGGLDVLAGVVTWTNLV